MKLQFAVEADKTRAMRPTTGCFSAPPRSGRPGSGQAARAGGNTGRSSSTIRRSPPVSPTCSRRRTASTSTCCGPAATVTDRGIAPRQQWRGACPARGLRPNRPAVSGPRPARGLRPNRPAVSGPTGPRSPAQPARGLPAQPARGLRPTGPGATAQPSRCAPAAPVVDPPPTPGGAARRGLPTPAVPSSRRVAVRARHDPGRAAGAGLRASGATRGQCAFSPSGHPQAQPVRRGGLEPAGPVSRQMPRPVCAWICRNANVHNYMPGIGPSSIMCNIAIVHIITRVSVHAPAQEARHSPFGATVPCCTCAYLQRVQYHSRCTFASVPLCAMAQGRKGTAANQP